MKWSVLVLPLIFLLVSCNKDEPDTKPTGEKPVITIVSPLLQTDYSDSLDVVVRFTDDSGLKSAAISLTRTNGNITYHSSVKQLNGSTADTLAFKAEVGGGFDISGSNVILVQCMDTDGNISVQEELFTVREEVDPVVTFTSFTTSVSPDPNQVIEVDFTATDNLGLDKYTAELWELNAQDEPQTLWKSFNKAGLNGQATYLANHKYLGTSSGYPSGSRYRVIVTVTDISGNTAIYNSEVGMVN